MKALLLSLAALLAIQWQGHRKLTRLHQDLTARRLEKMAAAFVEKGHRAGDDLLIEQAMQALASVSGVSFAAVADLENKTLAHSDPARLGQPLRWRTRPGLRRYPLKEGRAAWGTLVFGLSDPLFQRAARRQLALHLLGLGGAGLLFFAAIARMRRDQRAGDQKAADLAALLEEEKQRQARGQAQLEAIHQRGVLWLQEALDQIPYPAALLDSQLRLAALNRRAGETFFKCAPETPVGKSWIEIPFFERMGPALERSLASPGREVVIQEGSARFELKSVQNGAGGAAGAWIWFFDKIENQT